MTKTSTKQNNVPSKALSGRKSKLSVNVLVKVALLTAVAGVLQALDFPIPFVPPWLKLDFSDLPALIASFAFGPLPAVFVELIKNIIKMMMKASETGGVGELANFLLGASLVVPAGLVYRLRHDLKGAILGLITGIAVFCIMGYILNIYLIMPFYMKLYGGEAIINMAKGINPNFDSVQKIVMYGVTPFNLFKGLVIALVTLLIYKPLSPILRKEFINVRK